jgi:hypothetical protein
MWSGAVGLEIELIKLKVQSVHGFAAAADTSYRLIPGRVFSC